MNNPTNNYHFDQVHFYTLITTHNHIGHAYCHCQTVVTFEVHKGKKFPFYFLSLFLLGFALCCQDLVIVIVNCTETDPIETEPCFVSSVLKRSLLPLVCWFLRLF